MAEVDTQKPYLSDADVHRLEEEFTPQPRDSKLRFPSGLLLIADSLELGYNQAIEDRLFRHHLQIVEETIVPQIPHQRVVTFVHSWLYLPAADCGFYVYKEPYKEWGKAIRLDDNVDNPEGFNKARFEVQTETANLLIGDFDSIRGNLQSVLPPREDWPYEGFPKIPSTPYGQVIEISKNFEYDISVQLDNDFLSVLLRPQ